MSAQFIPLDRNPPSKDVSRMDRHVSSPTIPTAPYVPLKHTEAPVRVVPDNAPTSSLSSLKVVRDVHAPLTLTRSEETNRPKRKVTQTMDDELSLPTRRPKKNSKISYPPTSWGIYSKPTHYRTDSDYWKETLLSRYLKEDGPSISSSSNSKPIQRERVPADLSSQQLPLSPSTLNPPHMSTSRTMPTTSIKALATSSTNLQPLLPGRDDETMKTTKKMMTMEESNAKSSLSPKCRGTMTRGSTQIPVLKKPSACSEGMAKTSLPPSDTSDSRLAHRLAYPPPNGNASSKESVSTSISSSPLAVALQLMWREQLALETQRSALEWLNQNKRSKCPRSGCRLGASLLEQPRSLFPIALKSFKNMETTSTLNSTPGHLQSMRELSCTTSPCATKSREVNLSHCSTLIDSCNYIPPSSYLEVENPLASTQVDGSQERLAPPPPNQMCAIAPTRSKAAASKKVIVDTATSASNVGDQDTRDCSAHNLFSVGLGTRPAYLRYNVWPDAPNLSPTAADWTESARPLMRPPAEEFKNANAMRTIEDHQELFKIVTPIKVDVFESLLVNHPNQPFVRSVCDGLCFSFWPWAHTTGPTTPITHDESRPTPTDPAKAAFLRDQLLLEQSKGHFSDSFGPDLLPGMFCMPAYPVPKPNGTDMRLVTDHSAGKFPLNGLIDHERVTGYPLDNMSHLGEMLIHFRSASDNEGSDNEPSKLVMWKSDVAEAY